MKNLHNAISKRKTIIFFDLEGTQLTHEMIAIGAIKCSINSKGKIKKYYKPFKRFVKCKSKVGKVVEKLTLINDDLLKKEGIEFFQAMEDFKKYCGVSFKNALFCTFGSHDIRIIQQTMQYTFHCPKEICTHIIKNHFDFLMTISEFIKDDKNNPYSLVNYCKLFNVELVEPAHDPCADAINLAKLYDAFLDDKNLIFEEYKKVLSKLNHIPDSVRNILIALEKGEDVTQNKYEEILKQYIND